MHGCSSEERCSYLQAFVYVFKSLLGGRKVDLCERDWWVGT
jgi:hypothetical protein